MTTRAEVIAVARSWLATPFHHQARAKGAGVDCIGLVIGVSRELGLVAADFDVRGYARVPDGRSLLTLADQHMRRIDRGSMQAGDVIVVRWARDPQHFAILADYAHGGLSIIHAYGQPGGGGKVQEQRLDEAMLARFVAAYALPGVA